MKRVIITSIYPRHIEYVKTISEYYKIDHVFFEEKEQNDVNFSKLENEFFNLSTNIQDISIPFTHIKLGDINSPIMKAQLQDIGPDVILTFGCSLLKKQIFNIAKFGCINIHTGLVQRYRGVDSCYWAIFNDQPEAIGVTIHYIDKTIDAGNVLVQAQTKNLNINDTPYHIFLKTCKTGFDLLAHTLSDIETKQILATKLNNKGNLYLIKNMSNYTFSIIKNMCPSVLERYAKLKDCYDARIKLIC